MRGAGAAFVIAIGVLSGGCSRDPLIGPGVGLGASDSGAGNGDGGRNLGDALFGRDLAPGTPDIAHLACIGADQPANRVTGVTKGQPFTARTGVAGWRYGDGCTRRALVYLYEGALPAEQDLLRTPSLWLQESIGAPVDLGSIRPVDVYWRSDPDVDLSTTTGTVEWLRRDDQDLEHGVVEGILSVNMPGFMLSGHFIANPCLALHEICL